MVSKSILVALSVVALACNIVSTASPPGGGSGNSNVEMNPCVCSIAQIDAFFDLDLGIVGLLANVLNVAVDLIRAVLYLVGGLLRTLVGVVRGLLGGLLFGNRPSIPAPNDLARLLGVLSVGLLTEDRGLAVYFGSNIYKRDYLRNCFNYAVIQIMQHEGIDTSGNQWTSWCTLDDDFDFDLYCNELSDIIEQQGDDENLSSLLSSLGLFLNILLNNVGNLVGNLLGVIVSLLHNTIAGLSHQCGYKQYQQTHQCVYKAYDPVLRSHNCGSINMQYLTRGNYSRTLQLN